MSKDKKNTEKDIKDIEEVLNNTDNTTEKEAQKSEDNTNTDTDISTDKNINEEDTSDNNSSKEDKKKDKKGFFTKAKSKTDVLKEELETANLKIAEINDKYLRLYSEFDNFRKRTIKEKSDIYKTAGEDVIISIVSIIDDFERALSNIENSDENQAHREGLELIFNKFRKILENKNVVEIDAKGKEFDTDLHEAITQIPAPSDDMKDKVIDVVEKGYTMNDKVIRFSKVVTGA
ncbi:MAG: nucleotide exchange factor GrpE [Bacteroidales bacterium]|nr:nucleotide exchange factor GrpE [Bacteroidales bacterium]